MLSALSIFETNDVEPKAFKVVSHKVFRPLFIRFPARAVVMTCSDWCFPHTGITMTPAAQILSLRNMGNTVQPAPAISDDIDIALTNDGMVDWVICGHTDCDAMKRLAKDGPWNDATARTHNHCREHYSHLTGQDYQDVMIQENILSQVSNLLERPAVANAVSKGRLRLHAWIYDESKGEFLAFDNEKGQFVSAESYYGLDTTWKTAVGM